MECVPAYYSQVKTCGMCACLLFKGKDCHRMSACLLFTGTDSWNVFLLTIHRLRLVECVPAYYSKVKIVTE